MSAVDLGFDFLSMDPEAEPRDGCDQMGEVLNHWRAIGTAHSLPSDFDIASFLIKHYEQTQKTLLSPTYCVQCHSPLTLCCLRCSPITAPTTTNGPSSTPTATTSSSSLSTVMSLSSNRNAPSAAWLSQQKLALVAGTGEGADNWSSRGGGGGTEIHSGAISIRCESKGTVKAEKSTDSLSSLKQSKVTTRTREKVQKQNSETTGHGDDFSGADREKEKFDDSGVLTTGPDEEKGDTLTEAQLELTSLCSEELKCLLCSEAFTEVDQLTIHMQAHSADMSHKCDECGAAFLLPDLLQMHKKTHPHRQHVTVKNSVLQGITTKQQLQKRTDCFQGGSELQETEAKCNDLEQCPSRTDDTNYVEDLNGTTKLTEEESQSLGNDADIYGSDTDINSDLGGDFSDDGDPPTNDKTSHVLSDPSHSVAENEQVLKKYTVQHRRSSEPQPVNPADRGDEADCCGCQHCGESFHCLDSLVIHARSHYKAKLPRCRTCSKTFNTSSLLDTHHCRGAKRAAALNPCQKCNIEFSTPTELARHAQTHKKKPRGRGRRNKIPVRKAPKRNQPSHVCDICRTKCSTARQLQQHKRTEHKERRKFQCGRCGKELCNMQTLAAHERTHTGVKPYQCPQCPSAFRSSSNLRAHLRTHSGHTPYLCPQCGRGFKEITHLKRHLVSHSGEKPHQCQLCGKAYVHATSLKEHMESHSPSPKSWVCHQCGKAFANSKKLKVHLKTHNTDKGEGRVRALGDRRYTCQVCGAIYQQASSLSRHKKLHEAGATPHSCSDCGKTFRDKYELKKHSRTHSGLTPYQCVQCPRSFRDASGYKRHLLSHSGLKPHVCPQCNKGYADSKSLKHHLQAHTGVRPHSCPQCSKAFFTPWTLRLHLQRHAEGGNGSSSPGEKSHICHLCGATYLRASSLVRHQRLHEAASGQSGRYQCPQCSRSFGDSSHLKRHLLSHSGEKPFVCASCGKAYADSHTLKDHMQVHTGVRSFICEVCGKAFFNAKTLKEHARSHSDQRPFQCSQCSAAYKHLSGLIYHRRLHSGLRPFQCGECSKTFKDYTCFKRHQLTHSHHKPHVCQQCGKAYKDLKNLRHHQTQLHGNAA